MRDEVCRAYHQMPGNDIWITCELRRSPKYRRHEHEEAGLQSGDNTSRNRVANHASSGSWGQAGDALNIGMREGGLAAFVESGNQLGGPGLIVFEGTNSSALMVLFPGLSS